MEENMKEKYMTVSEVSTLTTLAKSTLYTYVHYQTIPFIRIGGRIVFEEDAVKEWIGKKRVKETERK
jgi:excisionase family DNA binding protein